VHGASTAFQRYPLWVASWDVPAPTLPAGWTTWALWQFTSTGTVPGITGDVDLDYAHIGVESLVT